MAEENLEEQCRLQENSPICKGIEKKLSALMKCSLDVGWVGVWFAGNCYLLHEITKDEYAKHPLCGFFPIASISVFFAGHYAIREAYNISYRFIDTFLHGKKKKR